MHHIKSTRFEKNINKNTKCRLLPFEFYSLWKKTKSKKICLSNKKMNCSSWKIKQRSNRNSNLVNVKLNFWFFDEWKWKLTTSEWNGWINEARPRVFHQSQSRFDPRIQEKLTGKVHIRFTNDHQVSVTFSAISLILL